MISRVLTFIMLLALVPAAVYAARVSPMAVDVQPAGRGSTARIKVTNPDRDPFPVEVRMFRGDISEAGDLHLVPADNDFIVFPAQALIAPNAQQVFRLQYVGDPDLKASQIYYLSVKQLPVAFKPGPPQVQVVTNFNVLVNVVPENTHADPVIQMITPAKRDDATGVRFNVLNNGTRYFSAGDGQWTITGEATDGSPQVLKFPSGAMNKIVGVGVVAPGKMRVFFVPTDKPLKEGTIKIDVK